MKIYTGRIRFIIRIGERGEKVTVWTKELFGTDFYHLIAAFIVYSMLGWLVESIYMSFCNRKLTNRGFGRGPFCQIDRKSVV